METNWEVIGKIMASKYRTEVLKLLSESAMMPTQLASKTDKNITHVSRTLKELEALGLIQCLNPKARKGKLYSLTTLGKEIREKIR